MIEVRFQRGLYLPEADLWLDPWDAKPRAFVSHAHADHFARHESILCSDTTAALLRHRFNLSMNRMETAAFHVPISRDGFRLRLLPAGHIPGSAMLHVTRLSDGASLLYTGDFKTRRSRTTESVNFLSADTLVIETTFGLPGYEFPNPLEVETEVLRFVHDSFADGVTPVLLGYALGKAQEALALLAENDIPVLLHSSVAAMTQACRDARVPGLPEPVEFDGHAPLGHVVIAPPHAVRTKALKGLKAKRTAMLSGWALEPGAKYRYRVDAMIPFSDHADHPGLLECIQRVHPRRVLTVHGFAKEFAAELRSRGMDAWCAEGGDQLELPIHQPSHRLTPARAAWHKRVVCPLADLSDLCRLVSETGSHIAKTQFISSYLHGLGNDDDLRIAARWLAGNILTPSQGKRSPLLNLSILRHALVSIPGARDDRFREIHKAQRGLTRTARLMLQELQLHPEALDLAETASFLLDLLQADASMDRIVRLTQRLSTLHPAEGETLVKLLTGDLRLDIDAALIEEAIASAFGSTAEEIRRVSCLTNDLGETAVLARHQRLHEAQAPDSRATGLPISSTRPATAELPFTD